MLHYGPNLIQAGSQTTALRLLLNQFKSPLVLILVFAAIISAIAGEWPDAVIVLAVVLGSTTLGFVQEYRASDAIEKLRSRVMIKSSVVRDGQSCVVLPSEVMPGDVVLLSAGSLIPADGVVLEANDLFVSQAVLTGEVFPVEKKPGRVEASASLMERVNCVFMGTSVRSGTARVLIVQTAEATVFGQIAERLKLRPPETEFERGVQRFGYLLTRVMLVMVVVVLAVNIIRENPALDSLLFALALAVGLAPELLPAIISITLAHGAQRVAKRGVIRASAFWVWPQNRSMYAPHRIHARMRMHFSLRASCCSSIHPRRMSRKRSSILPGEVFSSRSSPAIINRWRGMSRRQSTFRSVVC